MKSVIVYYSYGGNTRKIAQMIHDKKGYDLVEIKPVVPYTNDYQKLVDEEEGKMHQEEVVEIAPIPDLSSYDKIILGTPVWWYTITPPIRTFLKEEGLAGKTIVPFATNGGWIGTTFQDIQKYVPNSVVENPLNIPFNGDHLALSEEELNNWIEKL